jgi:hypothetical protein
VKRFGLKNSLSPSEGGSQGESRLRKQLVEAMTHIEATGFHVLYPNFSTAVKLHTYPPMEMEQAECSKTLAFKLQMPGNNPEESL